VTLPYAPRPKPGEGLSSWTARLAAHNFVDLTAFWLWIGAPSADDIAPSVSSVARLSAVTGVAEDQILAICGRPPKGEKAWITAPASNGYRGAACTVCCREAGERGHDHWWALQTQALMRVSCPIHGCALVDLDGLALVPIGDVLKLTRQDGGALGVERTSRALSERTLALERALADALRGLPIGPGWRVRSARSLLRSAEVLIDVVLYKESGQIPFAWLFEPERIGGPFILSLQASEPIKGLEALQGRSVRSRRNVLSALAALLSQPARLEGEIAELLYWRTVPDHQGPYRTLVDHIGRDGRLRLEAALQHLPAAIALPAAAALADDADLGGRSLHKPLAFRGNYERGL
jgi:hypothetical protein